ncbi:hypothetical protein SLEP1_g46936 [Rubroshorea leprosula]|uniref:Glycine-rich protein n=1 Tax=Rubroshorea leprosula TaxID=152421 RepID=A0AAV5LNV3_9ROSI|nr:hypothetical protein SLEP1_g46936 [Rubroshorea leprosula]
MYPSYCATKLVKLGVLLLLVSIIFDLSLVAGSAVGRRGVGGHGGGAHGGSGHGGKGGHGRGILPGPGRVLPAPHRSSASTPTNLLLSPTLPPLISFSAILFVDYALIF